MSPADIIGNRRSGMIAGAALLHLAAIAAAWVAIPAGIVTRLDRPIEASFAPMPSADQVDAQTTPRAQEVVSTAEQGDPAPEETARVVKDDAVAAEPEKTAEQPAVEPERTEAGRTPPMQQPVQAEAVRTEAAKVADQSTIEPPRAQPVEPDHAAPIAPASTAIAAAAPLPATEPAVPVSAPLPVPDVVAALASEQNVTMAAEVPQADTAPAAPAPAVQPDSAKTKPVEPRPIESKTAELRTVDADPVEARPARPRPVRPSPEKPRRKKVVQPARETALAEKAPKAKLAPKTIVPRAQQAGAGAVSDVGTADNARRSGATTKSYEAVVRAVILSHLRFPAGARNRDVEGTVSVKFVISGQGAVGAVQLARSSNDSTLDSAALALVRGLALPPPPYHPYVCTVPVRYDLP